MVSDIELERVAYELRRECRGRTQAFREKAETRALEGLARQLERQERVYYAHPKYGADKNYPTSLKMRFTLGDRETHHRRHAAFNWINANIQGKWSVDHNEDLIPGSNRDRIVTLSFEFASDALLTKLTLGNNPWL